MRHHHAPDAFHDPGSIREIGFEIVARRANEVIPDVRGTIRRRGAGGRLPRALNRFQRDADLRFTGGLR